MIPAWWATRRFARADDALAGPWSVDERAAASLVCSAPLMLIASVVIGAVALAVDTTVTVPWVLSATAGTANGAASFSLVPNGTGIAVVTLLLAAVGIARGRTPCRAVPRPATRRPGGGGVR